MTVMNKNTKKGFSGFIASEIGSLIASFVFFTRVPFPDFIISRGNFASALRYFPLVGWLTGALSAGAFLLSLHGGFQKASAIIVSMIVSAGITGALHEDGLADTFDGLGGGRSREEKLRIMKDSSTGTYGVLALLFSKGLLLSFLSGIPGAAIPSLLIATESFSRTMVLSSVLFLPYARSDSESKSGDVTVGYSKNIASVLISLLFGLAPSFYFFGRSALLLIIAPLVTGVLMTVVYHRKLNGYTGDMLGAIQQITSILMVGSFAILLQNGIVVRNGVIP